jgi:hypothetical protein
MQSKRCAHGVRTSAELISIATVLDCSGNAAPDASPATAFSSR